jgi:membrane peptidoglycan carboxypeptidase
MRKRLPDNLPRWAPWALAGVVALVAMVLFLRAFSVSCEPDVPCVTLAELRRGAPLPEAIHIYDRWGAPLADVAGPRRRALPEDRIPERLAAAWVAVEDRRFWDHDGVDVHGVIRAIVQNLRAGDIEEGASTIPMQLVRTLWAESLSRMGPWRRKVIEARMAPKLVDELGRRRVLALYLNAIYMGDGLHGVEEAARYYFGGSADSLDVAQTATLVGMTRSPERYHPRRHPDRARARRDVVLGVLEDAHVITPAEAEAARREPLRTVPDPPDIYRRSYVTSAVTRMIREVAPDLAGQPGLRVYTTIDPDIQQAGERALYRQLESIESGRYGPMPPADSTSPLQGAAVALDPETGAVRAWIGGRDFDRSEFDRVAQSERQVGSLVKPFLVASALESGRGILDLISADTVSVEVRDGVWSPDDHVEDRVLPMREALVRSSNRAAVRLGRSLGVEALRDVSRDVGIHATIPGVPSVFIGSFEASLLDMTGAFAAFANGGFRVDPYLLERIEDPRGRVLWDRGGGGLREQALPEVTAFVVLDALRDVVDRGTGWPVRTSGYAGPAAGKTGTTNDSRDAWFIGLVPELAAGVWIGYDQPRRIVAGGSGGELAGPAWGAWMQRVADHGDLPAQDWVPPLGVRNVRYDPHTGEAVSDACRSGPAAAYDEAYIPVDDYVLGSCPGTFRGILDRLWRALTPFGGPPRRRGGEGAGARG